MIPPDPPSPVRARAERTALKAELPALLSAKESLLLQMARIANMAPDGRTTWTAGALEEIAVLLHIAADALAAHEAERQELQAAYRETATDYKNNLTALEHAEAATARLREALEAVMRRTEYGCGTDVVPAIQDIVRAALAPGCARALGGEEG